MKEEALPKIELPIYPVSHALDQIEEAERAISAARTAVKMAVSEMRQWTGDTPADEAKPEDEGGEDDG